MVNFYETEKGEFCCDMCPDEEKNHEEVTAKNKQIIQIWQVENNKIIRVTLI